LTNISNLPLMEDVNWFVLQIKQYLPNQLNQ